MLPLALEILIAVFNLGTACHVVIHKRDPKSAAGWVILCLTIPLLGPILYWLLGVNRVRTRAEEWQEQGYWSQPSKSASPQPFDEKHLNGLCHSAGTMAKIGNSVAKRPLVTGNSIRPLHNGDEAFPVMLEAIKNARNTIWLSTYIFETNDLGKEFINALIDAANRIERVNVLVDGFGEFYSWPRVGGYFKKSKVKFARFLPLNSLSRGIHFNLRAHRKILVIDREIGFTGGMNIGGRHLVLDGGKKSCRDIHFQLKGPVIEHLESAFAEDWRFATGEKLTYDSQQFAPDIGTSICRGFSAGPNEDYEKLRWLILGAINSAEQSVKIMTPYFIPERPMIHALNLAVLRGVKVDLLLPAKSNLPFFSWASQAYHEELIRFGVGIHLQPPPFNHGKLLLVDDSYSLIGSANLDPRSLRLNFEFNVEIFCNATNQNLSGHFDELCKTSYSLDHGHFMDRRTSIKLRNGLVKLFSPYL